MSDRDPFAFGGAEPAFTPAEQALVDGIRRLMPDYRFDLSYLANPQLKSKPEAVPKPPPRCDIAALRRRVAAMVEEFGAPLPDGDAGIFEAARRLPLLEAWSSAVADEFEIDHKIEKDEIIPHFEPVNDRICCTLIETQPETLASAAVVLRYGIDHDDLADDLVGNVLELIERLVLSSSDGRAIA